MHMNSDDRPTPSREELDARSRQRWIERGFNPDLPIHEFFGCFSLKDAQRSLFDTTYSNPVAVTLTDDREGAVQISVVIYLATPSYAPNDETGIGYEDHPDWYFEGWVMNAGIQPEPVQRRVRILVCTMGTGEFTSDDMFEWQEISPDDPGARTIKRWR
jgi:hypothetical protein